MIYAPSYNIKGEAGEKITLPKQLFETKAPQGLVAEAARMFLANQRRARAKTLTRGKVEGSTRKIYRQKGTGRARHGSVRAPIFVGGGIVFGPSGEQNYKLGMLHKMKKRAFLGALGEKAFNKEVVVMTGSDMGKGKAREAEKFLKGIGKADIRTLVVVGKGQEKVKRAFGNLEKVTVAGVDNLNSYLVLAHRRIVITTEAVEEMKKYASHH